MYINKEWVFTENNFKGKGKDIAEVNIPNIAYPHILQLKYHIVQEIISIHQIL